MTDQTPAVDIVEELRTASRQCSGYEPSLSALQEVADRAATEIEALRAREAELQRKLDEAVEAVIDLRRAACRLPGVTMALGEHLDALDAALSSIRGEG